MVSVGAQRGGSVVIVKLIDPVQFCFLVVPKLKIAGEFENLESGKSRNEPKTKRKFKIGIEQGRALFVLEKTHPGRAFLRTTRVGLPRTTVPPPTL
jgi:hypothetical protein